MAYNEFNVHNYHYKMKKESHIFQSSCNQGLKNTLEVFPGHEDLVSPNAHIIIFGPGPNHLDEFRNSLFLHQNHILVWNLEDLEAKLHVEKAVEGFQQ